ncbi:hypothetical protein [Pseudorhizobium flavum]|uniref:hypothetical protein n=1 Tax=Pseudorhizobium flavum TaxID=1335061 RepID=UPI00377025B8
MDIQISHHASMRAQQRGIPTDVLTNLYRFGETRDARGALSVFLTKEALQDAAGELSKQDVQKLRRYRNSFLIVGDNARVVTAARMNRKRHFN